MLFSQEAQKAYEAAQYAVEQHAASASVPANVAQEEIPAASGDRMDVDVPTTSTQPQGKRKASEEPEVDENASKKVRMGMVSFITPLVSRLIVLG